MHKSHESHVINSTASLTTSLKLPIRQGTCVCSHKRQFPVHVVLVCTEFFRKIGVFSQLGGLAPAELAKNGLHIHTCMYIPVGWSDGERSRE